MTPDRILRGLWAAGIHVRLSADGHGLAVPAGALSSEQRAALVAHKPEILEFLRAARKTTEELLTLAMKVCDQHSDGSNAREQMRADIDATPVHLRADLLFHFKQRAK